MKDTVWSAGVIGLCSAIALLIGWVDDHGVANEAIAIVTETDGDGPLQPLPAAPDLDPDRVELGRRLFHDPLLSADGSVACASCHPLERGGADGLVVSRGIGDRPGSINTPSVLAAALQFRQFWDGRATTLEDQIDGPLQHPDEMGSTWPQILEKLGATREYAAAFEASYADGISPASVKNAIATFERSLAYRSSRFDRFLRGDATALKPAERRGYELFLELGCVGCHQGAAVGGNMFQRIGVLGDYFEARGGKLTRADYGRFNVTGAEEDRHVFKVPSLRNVALTAPYFHDASAATLPDAIRTMARFQLGREIPQDEVNAIAAFLGTLTADS